MSEMTALMSTLLPSTSAINNVNVAANPSSTDANGRALLQPDVAGVLASDATALGHAVLALALPLSALPATVASLAATDSAAQARAAAALSAARSARALASHGHPGSAPAARAPACVPYSALSVHWAVTMDAITARITAPATRLTVSPPAAGEVTPLERAMHGAVCAGVAMLDTAAAVDLAAKHVSKVAQALSVQQNNHASASMSGNCLPLDRAMAPLSVLESTLRDSFGANARDRSGFNSLFGFADAFTAYDAAGTPVHPPRSVWVSRDPLTALSGPSSLLALTAAHAPGDVSVKPLLLVGLDRRGVQREREWLEVELAALTVTSRVQKADDALWGDTTSSVSASNAPLFPPLVAAVSAASSESARRTSGVHASGPAASQPQQQSHTLPPAAAAAKAVCDALLARAPQFAPSITLDANAAADALRAQWIQGNSGAAGAGTVVVLPDSVATRMPVADFGTETSWSFLQSPMNPVSVKSSSSGETPSSADAVTAADLAERFDWAALSALLYAPLASAPAARPRAGPYAALLASARRLCATASMPALASEWACDRPALPHAAPAVVSSPPPVMASVVLRFATAKVYLVTDAALAKDTPAAFTSAWASASTVAVSASAAKQPVLVRKCIATVASVLTVNELSRRSKQQQHSAPPASAMSSRGTSSSGVSHSELALRAVAVDDEVASPSIVISLPPRAAVDPAVCAQWAEHSRELWAGLVCAAAAAAASVIVSGSADGWGCFVPLNTANAAPHAHGHGHSHGQQQKARRSSVAESSPNKNTVSNISSSSSNSSSTSSASAAASALTAASLACASGSLLPVPTANGTGAPGVPVALLPSDESSQDPLPLPRDGPAAAGVSGAALRRVTDVVLFSEGYDAVALAAAAAAAAPGAVARSAARAVLAQLPPPQTAARVFPRLLLAGALRRDAARAAAAALDSAAAVEALRTGAAASLLARARAAAAGAETLVTVTLSSCLVDLSQREMALVTELSEAISEGNGYLITDPALAVHTAVIRAQGPSSTGNSGSTVDADVAAVTALATAHLGVVRWASSSSTNGDVNTNSSAARDSAATAPEGGFLRSRVQAQFADWLSSVFRERQRVARASAVAAIVAMLFTSSEREFESAGIDATIHARALLHRLRVALGSATSSDTLNVDIRTALQSAVYGVDIDLSQLPLFAINPHIATSSNVTYFTKVPESESVAPAPVLAAPTPTVASSDVYGTSGQIGGDDEEDPDAAIMALHRATSPEIGPNSLAALPLAAPAPLPAASAPVTIDSASVSAAPIPTRVVLPTVTLAQTVDASASASPESIAALVSRFLSDFALPPALAPILARSATLPLRAPLHAPARPAAPLTAQSALAGPASSRAALALTPLAVTALLGDAAAVRALLQAGARPGPALALLASALLPFAAPWAAAASASNSADTTVLMSEADGAATLRAWLVRADQDPVAAAAGVAGAEAAVPGAVAVARELLRWLTGAGFVDVADDEVGTVYDNGSAGSRGKDSDSSQDDGDDDEADDGAEDLSRSSWGGSSSNDLFSSIVPGYNDNTDAGTGDADSSAQAPTSVTNASSTSRSRLEQSLYMSLADPSASASNINNDGSLQTDITSDAQSLVVTPELSAAALATAFVRSLGSAGSSLEQTLLLMAAVSGTDSERDGVAANNGHERNGALAALRAQIEASLQQHTVIDVYNTNTDNDNARDMSALLHRMVLRHLDSPSKIGSAAALGPVFAPSLSNAAPSGGDRIVEWSCVDLTLPSAITSLSSTGSHGGGASDISVTATPGASLLCDVAIVARTAAAASIPLVASAEGVDAAAAAVESAVSGVISLYSPAPETGVLALPESDADAGSNTSTDSVSKSDTDSDSDESDNGNVLAVSSSRADTLWLELALSAATAAAHGVFASLTATAQLAIEAARNGTVPNDLADAVFTAADSELNATTEGSSSSEQQSENIVEFVLMANPGMSATALLRHAHIPSHARGNMQSGSQAQTQTQSAPVDSVSAQTQFSPSPAPVQIKRGGRHKMHLRLFCHTGLVVFHQSPQDPASLGSLGSKSKAKGGAGVGVTEPAPVRSFALDLAQLRVAVTSRVYGLSGNTSAAAAPGNASTAAATPTVGSSSADAHAHPGADTPASGSTVEVAISAGDAVLREFVACLHQGAKAWRQMQSRVRRSSVIAQSSTNSASSRHSSGAASNVVTMLNVPPVPYSELLCTPSFPVLARLSEATETTGSHSTSASTVSVSGIHLRTSARLAATIASATHNTVDGAESHRGTDPSEAEVSARVTSAAAAAAGLDFANSGAGVTVPNPVLALSPRAWSLSPVLTVTIAMGPGWGKKSLAVPTVISLTRDNANASASASPNAGASDAVTVSTPAVLVATVADVVASANTAAAAADAAATAVATGVTTVLAPADSAGAPAAAPETYSLQRSIRVPVVSSKIRVFASNLAYSHPEPTTDWLMALIDVLAPSQPAAPASAAAATAAARAWGRALSGNSISSTVANSLVAWRVVFDDSAPLARSDDAAVAVVKQGFAWPRAASAWATVAATVVPASQSHDSAAQTSESTSGSAPAAVSLAASVIGISGSSSAQAQQAVQHQSHLQSQLAFATGDASRRLLPWLPPPALPSTLAPSSTISGRFASVASPPSVRYTVTEIAVRVSDSLLDYNPANAAGRAALRVGLVTVDLAKQRQRAAWRLPQFATAAALAAANDSTAPNSSASSAAALAGGAVAGALTAALLPGGAGELTAATSLGGLALTVTARGLALHVLDRAQKTGFAAVAPVPDYLPWRKHGRFTSHNIAGVNAGSSSSAARSVNTAAKTAETAVNKPFLNQYQQQQQQSQQQTLSPEPSAPDASASALAADAAVADAFGGLASGQEALARDVRRSLPAAVVSRAGEDEEAASDPLLRPPRARQGPAPVYVPWALALLRARAEAVAACAPTGLYVSCLTSPFLAAVPRPRLLLPVSDNDAGSATAATAAAAEDATVSDFVGAFLRSHCFIKVFTVASLSVSVDREPGCDCNGADSGATAKDTGSASASADGKCGCNGACDERRYDVESGWNYATQVTDRLNRYISALQLARVTSTSANNTAPALVLPLCLYSRDTTAALTPAAERLFPPAAPPAPVTALSRVLALASEAGLSAPMGAATSAAAAHCNAVAVGATCVSAAAVLLGDMARALGLSSSAGTATDSAAVHRGLGLDLSALAPLAHTDPRLFGLPSAFPRARSHTHGYGFSHGYGGGLGTVGSGGLSTSTGAKCLAVRVSGVTADVCADSLSVLITLSSKLSALVISPPTEKEVAVLTAVSDDADNATLRRGSVIGADCAALASPTCGGAPYVCPSCASLSADYNANAATGTGTQCPPSPAHVSASDAHAAASSNSAAASPSPGSALAAALGAALDNAAVTGPGTVAGLGFGNVADGGLFAGASAEFFAHTLTPAPKAATHVGAVTTPQRAPQPDASTPARDSCANSIERSKTLKAVIAIDDGEGDDDLFGDRDPLFDGNTGLRTRGVSAFTDSPSSGTRGLTHIADGPGVGGGFGYHVIDEYDGTRAPNSSSIASAHADASGSATGLDPAAAAIANAVRNAAGAGVSDAGASMFAPPGAIGLPAALADDYFDSRAYARHGSVTATATTNNTGVASAHLQPRPQQLQQQQPSNRGTAPQQYQPSARQHHAPGARAPAPLSTSATTSSSSMFAASPSGGGGLSAPVTFDQRGLPAGFVASHHAALPAPLLHAAVLPGYAAAPALPTAEAWCRDELAPAHAAAALAPAPVMGWHLCVLPSSVPCPFAAGLPPPLAHTHSGANSGSKKRSGVTQRCVCCGAPALNSASAETGSTSSDSSDEDDDDCSTSASATAPLRRLRRAWARASAATASLRAATAAAIAASSVLTVTVDAVTLTLHGGRDWRDSYLGAYGTSASASASSANAGGSGVSGRRGSGSGGAAARSSGSAEELTRHHYERQQLKASRSRRSSLAAAVGGAGHGDSRPRGGSRDGGAGAPDAVYVFHYNNSASNSNAGLSHANADGLSNGADLPASASGDAGLRAALNSLTSNGSLSAGHHGHSSAAARAHAEAEAAALQRAFRLTPFDWTPDVFSLRRGRARVVSSAAALALLYDELTDAEAILLCAAVPDARRGRRDPARRLQLCVRGIAVRQDAFSRPAPPPLLTAPAAAALAPPVLSVAIVTAEQRLRAHKAARAAIAASAPAHRPAAAALAIVAEAEFADALCAAARAAELYDLRGARLPQKLRGLDTGGAGWLATRIAVAVEDISIDDLVQASLVNKLLARLPAAAFAPPAAYGYGDGGGKNGKSAGRGNTRSAGKSANASGTNAGSGVVSRFMSTHGNPTVRATGGARPAVAVEVCAVRPSGAAAATREELRVRLALAPLKVNLDQDAADLVVEAALGCIGYRPLQPDWEVLAAAAEDDFAELAMQQQQDEDEDEGYVVDARSRATHRRGSSTATAGLLDTNAAPESGSDSDSESEHSRNIASRGSVADGDKSAAGPGVTAHSETEHEGDESENDGVAEVAVVAFIQRLEIAPLLLNIDYMPKRVNYADLQRGSVAELLHLFPLEDFLIALPALAADSISGPDVPAWLLRAVQASLPRQVASYLGAIQPVRAVAEAASGVADLVLVPLTHVRRDGLARGLLRGVRSLGVGLTKATLTATMQVLTLASTAVDALGAAAGPDLLSRRIEEARRERASRLAQGRAGGRRLGPVPEAARGHMLAHQAAQRQRGPVPRGLAEGAAQGWAALTEALQRAAQNIVAIPLQDYEEHGAGKAAVSVLRALPAAVLQPLAGTAAALSKVAQGAAHALDHGKRDVQVGKFKKLANARTSSSNANSSSQQPPQQRSSVLNAGDGDGDDGTGRGIFDDEGDVREFGFDSNGDSNDEDEEEEEEMSNGSNNRRY